MSAFPAPILPTELLEEILDHVTLDDHSNRTLRASARVDSVLRSLCQKRIFRDVTITYTYEAACHPGLEFVTPTTISIFDTTDGFNTGNGFLCFLQESPHIEAYVRTLRIQFLEGGRKISPNRHEFSLSSILPRLNNLETLVFSRLWGVGSDLYKDVEFNPLTERLLLKSMKSLPNSLSHIDTRGFAIFPLSLILQCPATGVKKLTFARLDSGLPPPGRSQPFHRRLVLNSLAMGTSTLLPSPYIDVSKLKSLKISEGCDFPVLESCVTSIIEGCRETLENLEVCAEWLERRHPGVQASTGVVESIFRCLNIQGHGALHIVTITITLNLVDGMDGQSYAAQNWLPLVDFVRDLAQSSVTTITLVIKAQLLGTGHWQGSMPSPGFFALQTTILARLLCSNAGGKKIRLVIRELHNHRTPYEYLTSMSKKAILELKTADPDRQLENMEQSGLLEFA